jgi:hypothetical protein
MSEKLKQIPPIYYFNLDHRIDRKKYIENQFLKYGIENYTRIQSSRYSTDNFDEWKSKVIVDKLLTKVHFLATLVDRIHGIIDWYNSGISETCLIVEDDICFDTVQYWNFDWNTLMKRIPCNWDCVQLHIIGENFIKTHLSKWTRNNHSTGCVMINRSYAEKLIKLHCDGDKFIFHSNYGYNDLWPKYHYQSVDFVLYQIGITYSIPIFITNSIFESDGYRNGGINYMAKKSDEVTLNWWKNKSSQYSLDDLFCLNTLKGKELILKVDYGS